MNTKPFHDLHLSTLGMGNMRLPQKGTAANAPIDWEASAEMIDYALEHGVNYFDTAWVYNEGESERCMGHCPQNIQIPDIMGKIVEMEESL